MNSLQASGFPKRPTRRGGRNRGKTVGSAGVPVDHMKNLTNAMETGDHNGARSHAFALIRSLPKAQQGLPRPNDVPGAQGPADAASSGEDDLDGPNVTSLQPPPKANTPAPSKGASPRLAQMLKGRKPPMVAAGY